MKDESELKKITRLLLILGPSIGGVFFVILFLLTAVAGMSGGNSSAQAFGKGVVAHGALVFVAILGWIPYTISSYRLALIMAILPLLSLLTLLVLLFI